MCQKQVCLFLWGYVFNYDDNAPKNEKYIAQIDINIELGQDFDTNILNTKRVSVWWWLQEISNT